MDISISLNFFFDISNITLCHSCLSATILNVYHVPAAGITMVTCYANSEVWFALKTTVLSYLCTENDINISIITII